MKQQFRYTVRVPVRPRGAEGIPWRMESDVLLDAAKAKCSDIMAVWHNQHPAMETLLSSATRSDFTINGVETCGAGGDFLFDGVPVP